MSNGPIFLYQLQYQNKVESLTLPQSGVQFSTQSTSVITGAAATSFTDSAKLTIGTGINRALVVTVAWSSTAPTGVSITWNGVALTNITAANSVNGAAGNTAIYVLLNPDPGTLTLAGSWTGARDFYVFGQAFTGVDQTGIATSFINATHPIGNNAAADVIVLPAVGNMDVAVFAVAGTINRVVTGTQAFIDNTQTAKAAAARVAGTGGTQHMTLDNVSAAWCISRVDLVAAAGTMSWFVPLGTLPTTRIFPASQQQFFTGSLFPITTVTTPYAGWDDILEWPRPPQPRSMAYVAPFTAFVPLAREDIAKLEWTTVWQDPVRIKPAALQLPFPAQPFSVFQARDNPEDWTNWPDFAPGRPRLPLHQPWSFIPSPAQVWFPTAPWDDLIRRKFAPAPEWSLIPQQTAAPVNVGWYGPLSTPVRIRSAPRPEWPLEPPVPATGGGSVVVDVSSPPMATGTSTATSAAFTAPAGSLLVVATEANADSTDPQVFTVTDTSGLGWSLQAIADGNLFPAVGPNSVSTLHTATVGASVSRTVTVTWTSGVSAFPHMNFKVYVVTGQAVYPTAIGATGAGVMTGTPATIPVFTATATNSLLVFGTTDNQGSGVAPTSSDLTSDAIGTGFYDALSGYKQLGAIGPDTAQVTYGGPSPFNTWVAVEIIAAPAGAAPPPIWQPWPDFLRRKPPLVDVRPWTFIPTPAQVFFPYAPWDDFTRRKPQPLDTAPLIWLGQTIVAPAPVMAWTNWPDFARKQQSPLNFDPLALVQLAPQIWYPPVQWPDRIDKKPVPLNFNPLTLTQLAPQVWFPYAPWDDFTRRKPQPLDTQPLAWSNFTPPPGFFLVPERWPDFVRSKAVPLNYVPLTLVQTVTAPWTQWTQWPDRIDKRSVPLNFNPLTLTLTPTVIVPWTQWTQWPDRIWRKPQPVDTGPFTVLLQLVRTPWNELSRWPEMVPIRSKAGLHAALQQVQARFPGTITQATVTGILAAFEVNSDAAALAVYVIQSQPAVRAAVSIQEIGTI